MTNDTNDSKEQNFIVDNKNSVLEKDNEMNERINRLFGESNIVEKKPLKEYDPQELKSVRKKLLFLFVGVIIAGVVIVILLFNPINFDFGKHNEKEPVQEENNNEKEEQNYPIELNLMDELVLKLNQNITISLSDFEEIDLFPLYSNDVTEFNNIPNNIKLFLMKKDERFIKLLNDNGVNDFVKTCDSNGITIDKNRFDDLVNSVFGTGATINYDTINYKFYSEDYESKKITLVFNNDKFIVKCNEYKSSDINKYIQQKLIKAIETESSVELYQKVVFISLKGNMGVYKEPTFNSLITDDKTAEFDKYIGQGNTYKYTFIKDEDNYYLSKIELVKEDN